MSNSKPYPNEQALTSQEVSQLVTLLQKLTPGFVPFPLFKEITRIWVTGIIELVVYRKTPDDTIETLLTKRPQDDPYWANLYHIPGTVIRADDTKPDFIESFERIQKEMSSTPFFGTPTFLFPMFRKSYRGTELSLIYGAPLLHMPEGAELFVMEKLPQNIIPEHIMLIDIAQGLVGKGT